MKVVLKVTIGLQTLWFEGDSFAQVVQQAIAAQLPPACVKAGVFFAQEKLSKDSKAAALLAAL